MQVPDQSQFWWRKRLTFIANKTTFFIMTDRRSSTAPCLRPVLTVELTNQTHAAPNYRSKVHIWHLKSSLENTLFFVRSIDRLAERLQNASLRFWSIWFHSSRQGLQGQIQPAGHKAQELQLVTATVLQVLHYSKSTCFQTTRLLLQWVPLLSFIFRHLQTDWQSLCPGPASTSLVSLS